MAGIFDPFEQIHDRLVRFRDIRSPTASSSRHVTGAHAARDGAADSGVVHRRTRESTILLRAGNRQ